MMEIRLLEMRGRKERRSCAVRRETIDQLIEQLFVVQKIGQWLAHETHGDAYVRVRDLNELFHQANVQLRQIKNGRVASRLPAPDVTVEVVLG